MAGTPKHGNITLTSAATEYGVSIGSFSKIQFQLRGSFPLLYSFESGGTVSGPYFTLKAGGVLSWEDMYSGGMKIYFQCATAGQILEIEAHECEDISLIV